MDGRGTETHCVNGGGGGKAFIAHNVEQKCKQIQNNK